MRLQMLGALLALVPAGCRSLDTAAPAIDAATFYSTVTLRGVTWCDGDSALLYSSDESGVFNAYKQTLDGSPARRLTDSTDDAILAVAAFPHDGRILFHRDRGGNELVHVFVRETDGRVVDLTPGEKVKARFVMWSGDRRSMLIATNERDPAFFDLYRYQADGYARTRVFENQAGFELGDMSLDGRWLCLTKVVDNADNDLYLWDATAPEAAPRRMTGHTGQVQHGDATFSADGRELWFTRDGDSDFQALWSMPVDASGPEQARLVAQRPWDVQSVFASRDGRRRVITINADARTQVEIEDLAAANRVALPDMGALDIQAFDLSDDGQRLACLAWSDTSPANLHVIDLASRKATVLTRTLSPAVSEDDLAPSRVIRYPSFDGLEIPALLYLPRAASQGARVPMLLWIHGGPGGQSRTGYNPAIQHLVHNGVGVLAVNNRGSSGYGRRFHHLDDRRHGEVDLDDCVYAKRWLEAQPWCAPGRVGIMGGSYGGYMVLAGLAYRPEEFAVGIDIFGVSNWLRTLESIPPWWASFRDSLYAEVGDPVADRERLTRMSPLFHADRIRRPLLVVQGANDPRVLQVESDEIVAACRRNGVPVEYLLFPDEGHGFQRRDNRIAASEAYLAFARRYLVSGE